MVAETQEAMNKAFDTMTGSFRAAVDAQTKMQERFVESFGTTFQQPENFETVTARNEKFASEFFPFCSRNMEFFAQACEANFRAGLGVVKSACDVMKREDKTDFYKNSRDMFDASFDAFRVGFDTFGKTATKTFENCSEFVEKSCVCNAPKQATKPATK